MTLTAPQPTPSTAPPGPAVPRRRATPERVALGVLLVGTGVLYLGALGDSGWANSFYAAAAQAGSDSWSAFFFGASDAAGSITVDKPPLSIWPMALSVRLFGLSSWSILVPQALMGVGTVALLHATVRRVTGSGWAGVVAGAAMATTPVAVLMFRFDNPDALLTLLLTGSAYAVVRAVQSERALRWLVLGGAFVGLAFLTKTLQAFLVLPGLALAYALFAAVPWRRRVGHLLAAFGAMLLAGGWWVAVVELVPASMRPYVGGSQTNSFLELTFGYNGFGRLTGEETGSVGGGIGWGNPSLLRLFGSENGGQVAWLLPAALVLGIAALAWGTRAVRTLAVVLLGWLVVTALTFSLMEGIYHAYYTVVLAPATGGLVALGGWVLWQRRESLVATGLLGGTVAMTTALAFALLDRTPDWHPWLRFVVAAVGFGSALLLVGVRHLPRAVASVVAVASLLAVMAGPLAYAIETAARPHTGSIPTAGPSTGQAGRGGPGGGGGPGGQGGGGVGGLLDGSTSTSEVTATLLEDASAYTWVAAAVGANSAAGYQLATEEPVMPIGLQRQRPEPDARGVPAARGRRRDPLVHRRRWRARRWRRDARRWRGHGVGDHHVGAGELRRRHRRRRDALRPLVVIGVERLGGLHQGRQRAGEQPEQLLTADTGGVGDPGEHEVLGHRRPAVHEQPVDRGVGDDLALCVGGEDPVGERGPALLVDATQRRVAAGRGPHQGAVALLVVDDVVEVGGHRGEQPGERVAVRRRRRLGDQVVGRAPDDGLVEGVLVAEVVVQQAARDAGLLGEHVDRQLVEGAGGQQRQPEVEELLAPLLGAEANAGATGHVPSVLTHVQ